MDYHWLKYAPPALAVHIENIKSGSFPEVEAYLAYLEKQHFERLPKATFGDDLNKEEHRAAENLEQVTGISMAALNTIYSLTNDNLHLPIFSDRIDCTNLCSTNLSKRRLLHWGNIYCGADLFISGLGTFNIKTAYNVALHRRRVELKKIITMWHKVTFAPGCFLHRNCKQSDIFQK